jgi:hypothetical protein
MTATQNQTRRPDRSAPILIRRSKLYDAPALARLAALDSRKLPEGPFLVAEVDGELFAAAPLDGAEPPLGDPFFSPTEDIQRLLERNARSLRQSRRARFRPSLHGLESS